MSSNGSLMDQFEEAFQNCVLSIAKSESNIVPSKNEFIWEVETTVKRFLEVARQMEAFFIHKRFHVSTLKPDQLLKDENQDLRLEIQRKDALLNKHYSHLEEWKACLADMQSNPNISNRPISNIGTGNIPVGMADIVGNMPGSTSHNVNIGGICGSQRTGVMANVPNLAISQLTQITGQHLQNQKMLQAQQMQQLRMMGKLNK